ncbi:hypothetical protein ACJJTC_009936 [Scirpophaga incertulas]
MQFTSDEAYARLISHNMTVPQRIKATGDIVDEDSVPNGWDYANEKFDMKVPERILVVGQDQHIDFTKQENKEKNVHGTKIVSPLILVRRKYGVEKLGCINKKKCLLQHPKQTWRSFLQNLVRHQGHR